MLTPKTQPCSGIHILRSEGEPGLEPSSQKKLKGKFAALDATGREATGYLLLCILGRTAPDGIQIPECGVPTLKLLQLPMGYSPCPGAAAAAGDGQTVLVDATIP